MEIKDAFNTDLTMNEFINNLSGKELVIFEDIQGSKIYVNFTGDRFIIKPKSMKNDELNFVDLAIQKYYNLAYVFFHTIPSYITDILNKNWYFCFEYLVDNQAAHIEYAKIPKNNLILTSIVKNNKHTFNYDEIIEYANLFEVEPLPVIYKGELTSKQLEVIRLFLQTKEEDLKFIFGENNFSKFFYNILNPNLENSFLMKDGKFNNNLEKLIIRINGDNKYSFELLNPLYKRTSEEYDSDYTEIYSLILINFLEFLQLKTIKNYKPNGLTISELYINLISILFNDYMNNMEKDIDNWDITIPSFIKKDKFKINIDLIRNKDTKELIKHSEKIEYIFKVILGAFNKKRKKKIGVMTEKTVELFNSMVDAINKHLESLLNINRDYNYQKIDLLNFQDYFNMRYDKDGVGQVYPDVSVKFEKEPTSSSDKVKKGSFNK